MALNLGLGGIGRAFASRNFRIFWVGNLTHNIAVWINRMAVAWLTWQLTQSPAWLGIMAAAGSLPTVFIGPLAGVTADRFGHRFQLVTATYVGAGFSMVLAIMVATGTVTVAALLVLVGLSGIIRALNIPARISLIHSLVDRATLSSAIGVNSATFYGGNFVGPAIGGVIISAFGIAPAFFVYAAGEVIAATSFLILNIEKKPKGAGKEFSLWADFLDGVRYTMGHRGILTMIVLSTISTLFLHPYMEMLAGFAAQVFGRGADGLAMLTASTGAGAMTGGLWIAQRGRMQGLVRIQLVSLVVGMAAMIGFVATDEIYVSMGFLYVVGFCLVSAQVANSSMIQNAVAPGLRARVVSFGGVVNLSAPALGAIVIGWAATKLGLRLPVGSSAVLAFLVLLCVLRPVLRNAQILEAGSDSK
jgi:MFS family permease